MYLPGPEDSNHLMAESKSAFKLSEPRFHTVPIMFAYAGSTGYER
jgi:hypothetical protein